jgi:hypothetical protein
MIVQSTEFGSEYSTITGGRAKSVLVVDLNIRSKRSEAIVRVGIHGCPFFLMVNFPLTRGLLRIQQTSVHISAVGPFTQSKLLSIHPRGQWDGCQIIEECSLWPRS